MEILLAVIAGTAIPLFTLIWKIWVDRQDRVIISLQVRPDQQIYNNEVEKKNLNENYLKIFK